MIRLKALYITRDGRMYRIERDASGARREVLTTWAEEFAREKKEGAA
jgi:hypothetical protein